MALDPKFSIADFYHELMAEMRWRRETEFKLLAVHIAVCSASVALMLQGIGKGMVVEIFSPIVALALTIVSWSAVTAKIKRENRIYNYLGSRVVRIWEEHDLFKPWGASGLPLLEDKDRQFGSGGGSQLTLRSVKNAGLVICVLALVLLATALFPIFVWFLGVLSSQ